MAYISESKNTLGATLANIWHAVGSSISTFFADFINANARSEFIQELQRMDDATLKAKHGITREQIVLYVFSDKLYV